MGEIVEIAAVRVTPKLRTKVLMDSFVRPSNMKQAERSWIVSNGFIELSDLKTAPPADQVASELNARLNSWWTSFNVDFDSKFIFK